MALRGDTRVTIDFSARILQVRSTLLDSIATGPPLLLPLDPFLEGISTDGVRSSLREAFRQGLAERALAHRATQEGLVPDIELPVKLPGILSSVIGQGGNIRVSGHQRIAFSGESSYELGQEQTDFDRNSAFPDLGMEQELVLNLQGTVGTKVHIDVNHNSTAGAEAQNKIKLSYEGDEDEIVQSIEAGDTQLSLPSTRFVGVNAQSKGLFGVKARGRVGDLDLTLIASKQKGNAEEGRFLGQATLDTLVIHDIEYVSNRFFALELDPSTRLNDHPVPVRGLREPGQVLNLRVYFDDGNGTNSQRTGAVPGSLFLDGEDFGQSLEITPLDSLGSFVRLIEQQDYIFDPQAGALEILPEFRLDDSHRLAVAYTRRSARGDEAVGSTLGKPHLKLLKEPRSHPDQVTWPYMLRNRYDLGARNIPAGGFVLKVERIVNEAGGLDGVEVDGSGTPYMKLLGLDPDDDGRLNTDVSVPENQFALIKGILTIPDQPVFADGASVADSLPFPWLSTALDENNPDVYKTQKSQLRTSENARFRLRAAFKQIRSSFSLGHINILPNSEVVRVDGRTLERDRDYTIVYEVGQITFVTPPSPTSTVKINYEYAPFFDLAQKTLLGIRSTYKFLDGKGGLGATWLYESQRAIDQKPRVGREVGRIQVADVDAHLEIEPEALTRLTDALPLVEASRASKVRLEAEVAASRPNPNLRNEAYVDDMEAVETVFGLLGTRRTWSYGSKPSAAGKSEDDAVASGPGGIPDSLDHGSANWYNPELGDRPRRDEIFEDLPTDERNDGLTVLRLELDPRGPSPEQRRQSYMSLQRSLSSLGVDLLNRSFIEAWIAIEGEEAGRLHIDLGTVSEDQNRRNRRGELIGLGCFDTEDANIDGLLQNAEDIGLDGIADIDSDNPACGENECGEICDAGNDDYDYQQGVYSDLNGTEGNNTLDTEDMDEDGGLDLSESFFRYSIDLDDPNDPRVVAGDQDPNSAGRTWRRYRIPLTDALIFQQGSVAPSLREIKHVRLWYDGVEEFSRIAIANLDVVGNTWLEREVRALDGSPVFPDERLSAATVSTREDEGNGYKPPPGVTIERDTDGRLRNEQSLEMKIEGLRPGHEALLVQPLFQATDYTMYGGMEVFVQGHQSAPELFIQMGADSLNYYEWRIQVQPNQSGDPAAWTWQQQRLDFQALTLFKDDAEKAGEELPYVSQELSISVVGRPSLTRVKRLALGVRNLNHADLPGDVIVPGSGEVIISDGIWVDDLRLVDVRKDPGVAARVSGSLDLAGFASLSGTWQFRDSEFHGLGTNRGQGSDQTNWTGLGDVQLDRLLPPAWGFSIPLKGSITRTQRKPRLAVGSDVLLDKARSEEQRAETKVNDASLRFSKKRRRGNPWVNLTIDNLSGRASWRREQKDSYVDQVSQLDISGALDWEWTQRDRREFKILGPIGISLMPSALSFGSGYTRRDQDRWTKLLGARIETSNIPLRDEDLENSYSSTWAPFRGLTLNHGLTENRDLRSGASALGRQDRLSMRSGINLAPKLTRWVAPKAGYTVTYNENKSKEIQSPDTAERLRNLSTDGRVDLSLTVKPNQMFGGTSRKSRSSAKNKEKGEEEEEEQVEKPSIWSRLGGGWRGWLGSIEPVTFTAVQNDALRDPNAIRGGSVAYMVGLGAFSRSRYGLRDEDFYLDSRQGTAVTDRNIRGSTGLRLPARTTLRFSINWIRRLSAYDALSVEDKLSNTFTFPDLSLSFGGLADSRLLKQYVKSSSLSSGLQVTETRSGSVEKGGSSFRQEQGKDVLDRREEKVQWRPMLQWQTTWKNDVTTTLSHSRAQSYIEQETRRQLVGSTSWRASLRYTLNTSRGVDLPLFGHIKLRGNVRAGIEASLDDSETYSVVPGVTLVQNLPHDRASFDAEKKDGALIPDSRTRTITVEPTADYEFSRTVDGGLQFRWSRNINLRDDRTIQDIKITVWTMFRF